MQTDWIFFSIGALVGLAAGLGFGLLWARSQFAVEQARVQEREAQLAEARRKTDERDREIATLRSEAASLREAKAGADAMVASLREQQKLLEDAERILGEKFDALSLQSLKSASDELVKLNKQILEAAQNQAKGDLDLRKQAIEEMIEPMKERLKVLDETAKAMEEKRIEAYAEMLQRVQTLDGATRELHNALRKPQMRGSWGEITLTTAAEQAGLVEGVHFELQVTADSEEGRSRPDMVIRLPKKNVLIIDSKVPLDAFMEAVNTDDPRLRDEKLQQHARLVREHVKQLSSRRYHEKFDHAPEFVILYLPTEAAYQAAFEYDRTLIPDSSKQRVIIANPLTIYALFHTVHYVVDQERLHDTAEEVRKAGREIYERMRVFVERLAKVGSGLRQSVNAYNEAVGSLEGRLLPAARRIKELGAGTAEEVPAPAVVEATLREPRSGEHLAGPDQLALEPGESATPDALP